METLKKERIYVKFHWTYYLYLLQKALLAYAYCFYFTPCVCTCLCVCVRARLQKLTTNVLGTFRRVHVETWRKKMGYICFKERNHTLWINSLFLWWVVVVCALFIPPSSSLLFVVTERLWWTFRMIKSPCLCQFDWVLTLKYKLCKYDHTNHWCYREWRVVVRFGCKPAKAGQHFQ